MRAALAPRASLASRLRVLWIVLALVAAVYCGWRFTHGSPLETNLLALLPATERDEAADRALESLAATTSERAVFVVTSHDDAHAKEAARQLGAALTASGAFRSVTAELPPFDIGQIARFYTPYRFGLLDAADRERLEQLADHGAGAYPTAGLTTDLLQRLANPLPAGMATPVADDPLGWLEHWLGTLPLNATRLELDDNLLVARDGQSTSVLVSTTLPASAYDAATQRAVLAAANAAQASLAKTHADVSIARTGAVFYAQAARSAAESDVRRVGAISLVGIGLLMLWVFRSPRMLLLGFVSTALGIVFALAITLALFDRLHLLTLVFGASLIGEAVDYSIQYFVACLGPGREWDSARGARAVRPALTVALATSLLGYAVLMFVPFPALMQIACFAMVGITTAFASVLWLLPALLARPPRQQPRAMFERAARLLDAWHACLRGPRAWLVCALVVAVAVPGWLKLTSDDDIHLLIARDPGLAAQETTVRDAIGIDAGAQFFVVHGANDEAVLERSNALLARLAPLVDAGQVRGVQAVSSFVPSVSQQRADQALLDRVVFDNPIALRATLVEAGLRESVVDAWLHARTGAPPLTVDTWLAAPWSTPYRQLWVGKVDDGVAAIVLPLHVDARAWPAVAHAASGLAGVSFVDKAASVSRLFGVWRVDSGKWLSGALVVVFGLLAWRYGIRAGAAVLAPVVLAIMLTLAGFGYAHVPLNLFNWLALMLVLGVGGNYAVFLREGSLRAHAERGAVFAGVLLSAATTLLSFGLLGLSSMPALKSFGVTLASGIAIAVLFAPLGMRARGSDA